MDEENINFFNNCKEKAQEAIDHFDAKEAREIAKEFDYRTLIKYSNDPKIQWRTTNR